MPAQTGISRRGVLSRARAMARGLCVRAGPSQPRAQWSTVSHPDPLHSTAFLHPFRSRSAARQRPANLSARSHRCVAPVVLCAGFGPRLSDRAVASCSAARESQQRWAPAPRRIGLHGHVRAARQAGGSFRPSRPGSGTGAPPPLARYPPKYHKENSHIDDFTRRRPRRYIHLQDTCPFLILTLYRPYVAGVAPPSPTGNSPRPRLPPPAAPHPTFHSTLCPAQRRLSSESRNPTNP